MPNKYTEQLLSIPVDEKIGFDWTDLARINLGLYLIGEKFSYTVESMYNDKLIIIAFLATLSDKELEDLLF